MHLIHGCCQAFFQRPLKCEDQVSKPLLRQKPFTLSDRKQNRKSSYLINNRYFFEILHTFLYLFYGKNINFVFFFDFVYPTGEPMTPHLLRYQELAVPINRDGCVLDALNMGYPQLSLI